MYIAVVCWILMIGLSFSLRIASSSFLELLTHQPRLESHMGAITGLLFWCSKGKTGKYPAVNQHEMSFCSIIYPMKIPALYIYIYIYILVKLPFWVGIVPPRSPETQWFWNHVPHLLDEWIWMVYINVPEMFLLGTPTYPIVGYIIVHPNHMLYVCMYIIFIFICTSPSYISIPIFCWLCTTRGWSSRRYSRLVPAWMRNI